MLRHRWTPRFADCKSVGLRLPRFESCTCHAVMSQDIVDSCSETLLAFRADFQEFHAFDAAWLVVAAGV